MNSRLPSRQNQDLPNLAFNLVKQTLIDGYIDGRLILNLFQVHANQQIDP